MTSWQEGQPGDVPQGLRRLGGFHFGHGCVEVLQGFLHGQRVHVTADAFARLQRSLEVMAGDFYGERVGNVSAGALFVFHPRGMRQRDPNPAPVNQKLVVDGVSVAGGDGDDLRLIDAVDLFSRPAVRYGEILKHSIETIAERSGLGQTLVELQIAWRTRLLPRCSLLASHRRDRRVRTPLYERRPL